MSRFGLSAVAVAAWLGAESVAVAAPVAVEVSDPDVLFDRGDFPAAAVAYEKRWRVTSDPYDGVNAVIALRCAGQYSRALALLHEVQAPQHPGALLEIEKLLDSSLGMLTGVIEWQGSVPADAILVVDGGPAEIVDGKPIVNAGRRNIELHRTGCETFRWTGVVNPGQRVPIPFHFVCHSLPGSIHLTLSGAAGARVRVDGRETLLASYDADFPVAPGQHHVEVTRRGLSLLDRRVYVPPATSRSIAVAVPWRAKSSGIVLGVTSQVIVSAQGPTATGGVVFGYQQNFVHRELEDWIDRSVTGELLAVGGLATTGVGEGTQARPWFGLVAGVPHLLPPLWQVTADGATWVLDLEPALLAFGIARASRPSALRGFSESASVTYAGLSPIILTCELPFAHAELALWPLGLQWHQSYALLDGPATRAYAGWLSLTLGWKVLGD